MATESSQTEVRHFAVGDLVTGTLGSGEQVAGAVTGVRPSTPETGGQVCDVVGHRVTDPSIAIAVPFMANQLARRYAETDETDAADTADVADAIREFGEAAKRTRAAFGSLAQACADVRRHMAAIEELLAHIEKQEV